MLGAVEIWNGREGPTASSLLPSVLDPKGLGMDLWSVFVKGGERKVARKSFFLNESGRRATDYIGPVRLAEKHCSG